MLTASVATFTVEPLYNEGSRNLQNSFAIERLFQIEILFINCTNFWGEENRSLYLGFRYIEVCYIEVPLHKHVACATFDPWLAKKIVASGTRVFATQMQCSAHAGSDKNCFNTDKPLFLCCSCVFFFIFLCKPWHISKKAGNKQQ